MRGSRAFVDTLEPAVADGMKGMLNFDMVGVNNSLAVGGSEKLVDIVRGIDPGVGRFDDSGSSDHASFMSEGIPGVFFWRGFEPNYHLPGDLKTASQLIDEVVDLGIKNRAEAPRDQPELNQISDCSSLRVTPTNQQPLAQKRLDHTLETRHVTLQVAPPRAASCRARVARARPRSVCHASPWRGCTDR
ncbi:MAG: M28 family peptidase [Pleurocapsa sp. SU_196_0]|nr:M28 family peptidase [Pleurocapsa sp. SU_196_0]